ncbi:MAG: DUF3024 domain-containing protein [Maribacter sp.]|nr:DUF3024 domain-containing protein [Maribacter sp.]
MKLIDKSVGNLCRERTPAKNQNELRFTYEVKGHGILVWEERPGWRNPEEWTKMGVAKFLYTRSKKQWKLYWMRRDLKWHLYDPDVSVSNTLEPLVSVVAQDQWGAFFG